MRELLRRERRWRVCSRVLMADGVRVVGGVGFIVLVGFLVVWGGGWFVEGYGGFWL